MKILSKLKIAVTIIALLSVSISCDKDEEINKTPDLTITGVAKENPNLTILVQALIRANLASTLQSVTTFNLTNEVTKYTVFAPTNEAFTEFLATTDYETINDVPVDVLRRILLNHVVSGTVKSTDLTTGYVETLATSATSGTKTMSMYVDLTSGVKLNGGAKVSTADVMASNGVIHIVDAVINLPTIVTHATANPNFTSLIGALTKPGQPDFVTILSGTGPFTVFAPTNAAFTAFNTELAPGGIAGVSDANLTKVLQYHVVNGNILAASLTEGQIVTTLQTPQTFTVQLAGGAKIKDVRNRISNITATDVQCSNGVIHVLDKVLYPTL
jgi:uncharacterized surface protein with fasciclin (FAS1) repeats